MRRLSVCVCVHDHNNGSDAPGLHADPHFDPDAIFSLAIGICARFPWLMLAVEYREGYNSLYEEERVGSWDTTVSR